MKLMLRGVDEETLPALLRRGTWVQALRATTSPLVVRALLQNPRFDRDDALSLAVRADTPAATLTVLAESPRFEGREDLSHAITVHPAAPAQTALRLLSRLSLRILERIAADPKAAPLVRLAAERRLERTDRNA